MKPDHYQQIFQSANVGIAHHRIHTDDAGKPVDYEFIEVNAAYEKFTGLVSSAILHKSTQQLSLSTPLTEPKLLQIFGDIALNGGQKDIEVYFPSSEDWYEIQILSPEKFFFTTILNKCSRRKKLEAGLKAEATFWNEVFSRIPGIFFMLRDEGQFVMWNHDLKEYLGVTEEQMPALNALNHFVGADKQTVPMMIQNTLNSGSSNAEAELISLNGKAVPFFLTCHRISLHGLDYLIGAGQDISQQKYSEKRLLEALNALGESEARLKAILDSEPECVKLVSADGQLLEMNPTGLRMLEVDSLEEAQNLGLLSFVERSYRSEFIKLHRNVMAGDSGILEFRIIGQKGRERWLETHATPLRNKAGNIIALLGLTRDITEQKRSIEALNMERVHLTTLIETLPDLVWLKNADGVYLSCNRRFEKFFGAKVEQIIGKTDYDFVDKEMADFFREHDCMAIAAGPLINEELVTFASDGHQELLETTKTPMLDSHGKLIGILGIGHDITERKKIQDDLSASESRLRAILSTTRECVKLVSHDGTLISMNPAGLELIEVDRPEDVVKHCIYEVLAPEYRQTYKEFNERICEGGGWRKSAI